MPPTGDKYYSGNALATSKGMWAVKLYTNKILQFLAGSAG